jgi:5'-nucleotidase/UDP-sugar diphosphatase
VDLQRTYRLALPSFVARGGDGYPDLRQHPGYQDTGVLDRAILEAFLTRHSPIDPSAYAPGSVSLPVSEPLP